MIQCATAVPGGPDVSHDAMFSLELRQVLTNLSKNKVKNHDLSSHHT
jgi:hypothetical protein